MANPDGARRRTLPRSAGYALAAYIVGLSFFAALTPTPLYVSYSRLWALSPLVLTMIYATYAAGVLAALLFFGRTSDQIGRRPVLLASLAVLLASTVLFVVASTPAILFLARGLQGLATGAAISAASAVLLDLHARRDPLRAGLANAVASSLGIALGVLAAAVLVESGWAPLVLPYVLLLALTTIALLGVVWMPEPVTRRGKLRLALQRPHVPASVRGPFVLASLITFAAWALGGLFFSLGPALGGQLFDSADVVVGVIGIVVLGASAALSQLLLHRTAPWLGAAVGSAALSVGVLLIVLAAATDSGLVSVVGYAAAGIGFGIGFLGGLRGLVTSIPAEHRASVMSAFYIVAYIGLSLPAVLAGLVVERFGLTSTFEGFGIAVALMAVAAAVIAWRTRPAAMAARAAPTRA